MPIVPLKIHENIESLHEKFCNQQRHRPACLFRQTGRGLGCLQQLRFRKPTTKYMREADDHLRWNPSAHWNTRHKTGQYRPSQFQLLVSVIHVHGLNLHLWPQHVMLLVMSRAYGQRCEKNRPSDMHDELTFR